MRPDALTSDEPVAGFYTIRLMRGGIMVPVRLYFGQPVIDGERQDRPARWCAIVNGTSARNFYGVTGLLIGRVPHDVERVWPWCARNPISRDEYRFLLRRAAWARQHAPDHPAARPWETIDIRALKPAF